MRRLGEQPLALLFLALCGGACAAGVEGDYAFGAEGEGTIRVVKGREEGTYVGVLVGAEAKWLEATLSQPVLDLKRVAEGVFRGRVNAHPVRLSAKPAEWLDVARAELLPNGDLRCTLRDAGGGSAQILFRRLAAASEPGAAKKPAGKPGELSGAWQDEHGAVTHYVSHKDRYVGQIAKLSPQLKFQGFRVGDERVRVRRTAPGVYRGTVRLRTSGGKRERWAEAEVAVKGDGLELVVLRDGKPTTSRYAATRLGSGGGAPSRRPAAPVDDGDLVGVWRDSHGGINRFERKGDSNYEGVVVKLAPQDEGFGFAVGEVGIRVTRTGRYTYEGKVLAKTFGGRSQWWERIEIAVLRDALKYTRHMRRGGVEHGAARRTGK